MRENRKFDITRRNQSTYSHYQLFVKVLRGDRTEHHTVEVFAAAGGQLNKMRRLYATICSRLDYTGVQRLAKNN